MQTVWLYQQGGGAGLGAWQGAWQGAGEAGLLAGAAQSLAWLLHTAFLYCLHHRLSLSVRGPWPALAAWAITAPPTGLQLWSALGSEGGAVQTGCAGVAAGCQLLYLLCLLPAGDQRPSHYTPLLPSEHEPLLGRVGQDYGGFREEAEPGYLGRAGEGGRLARLLLAWLDPLVSKAGRTGLHQADDVFDLPDSLTPDRVTAVLADSGPGPLRHQLRRGFGRKFLCIGLLKLFGDCAGFSGPILLNCLVSYLEEGGAGGAGEGVLYAVGLAAASLAAALASCHFNLQMAGLGVQVRAALNTAVYRQTVWVSRSRLAAFSTGQIINFMSCDTDRVVNFAGSLHAAWSLPFQLAVTLVLLYQQVGISFLAGLGLTVLLIPVNRWIAQRIGSLSEEMLAAKDKRVSLMSELLTGIRVIKCFNWESTFSQRVATARKQELSKLAGRYCYCIQKSFSSLTYL